MRTDGGRDVQTHQSGSLYVLPDDDACARPTDRAQTEDKRQALTGAVSIAVLAQQRINCGDAIPVLYDAVSCRPRLGIAANIGLVS